LKKLNNKKGLFLAEILLAVVIAAVIMGSGFLVYKNIKSENEKNDAIRDLNMIISMVTPIFTDERGQGVQYDTRNSGRVTRNPSLIKTQLLVKGRMLPTTMKTTDDDTLITSYGYAASIGLAEYAETSNWRIIYHNLDRDQCSKLVQAAIKATKPMAVGTASYSRRNTNTSIATGGNWPRARQTYCATASSPLQIVQYTCMNRSYQNDTSKIDVSFWYSPNNENLNNPRCTPQGKNVGRRRK
jgi:hypothetical protein